MQNKVILLFCNPPPPVDFRVNACFVNVTFAKQWFIPKSLKEGQAKQAQVLVLHHTQLPCFPLGLGYFWADVGVSAAELLKFRQVFRRPNT